jgi:hypothetical protein
MDKFTLKNGNLIATRKLGFFESLIVEAMEAEGEMPQEAQEDVRKGVAYLFDRLKSEKGGTSYQLAQDWFAGLAMHVPYMNHDILERAKAFGALSEDASEETQDRFLVRYFGQLASALFGLRREFKI